MLEEFFVSTGLGSLGRARYLSSSNRQSHASAYRRSLAVSSTIISYICLCGHLGGVSEIQTSLDVSDL